MFAGNVGRVGRQTPMGGVGGASLPSLDLDFMGGVFDPRITFARGGTVATRFNSGGVLETIGANLPRFDYDPSTATTNQLILSENFVTSWSASGGIAVGLNNVAISPRGDMTAGRVETGDTANGSHTWFRAFTGGQVNTAYVASIYAKADQYPRLSFSLGNTAFANVTNGGLFDLTTGTVVAIANGSTCTIAPVGNGWYRLSVTATSDADGGNYIVAMAPAPSTVVGVAGSYTPTATGLGVFVWGTQVEVGTVMSNYIQTTGTVTSGNATPRGLLIEEARTNSVANSTMVGASAPSTLPTTWGGTDGLSSGVVNGITTTVEGTGTESGIPYIDFRMQGTAVATSGAFYIRFSLSTAIAALNGQIWTNSTYLRVVGGSTANLSAITLFIGERDVGGANLASTQTAVGPPTTAALATQRYTISRTNNNAATAFELGAVAFGFVIGLVYDFTIRVGAPQLEFGVFPTSFIPTSTVAVTRTQDLATMPLSSWFNSTNYSLYAEGSYPYAVGNAQQGIVVIDDGTANQRNTLRGLTPVGGINISFVVGGVATATANNGLTSPGVVFKSAYSAVSTGTVISTNGQVPVSGAGAMPTGLTIMRLGQNGAGAAFMDGHLRRVKAYPRALAPIELQSLTVL